MSHVIVLLILYH